MIFLDSMPSPTLPAAVCGLTGIIPAITEPKRAQAKLAKKRALLRCLIDAVGDLIFIKDQDGVYRGCNKASEAFIGTPESEQIGKADRQVLEQGKPPCIEEWVTSRDGRRLMMDTLKAPYYGPDGEALELVGIGRDLTDRKSAEAAPARHGGRTLAEGKPDQARPFSLHCRALYKEMEMENLFHPRNNRGITMHKSSGL